MTIDTGNGGILELKHVVFDVNGTLTKDGQLVKGTVERIHALRQLLTVHLLTADTYRTQEAHINVLLAVDRDPKISWRILDPKDGPEDEQKGLYVAALGPTIVAAVGNGRNDRVMLKKAKLGIAVVGPEGASAEALAAATIVASDPITAIDLLLHPLRLKASLRF